MNTALWLHLVLQSCHKFYKEACENPSRATVSEALRPTLSDTNNITMHPTFLSSVSETGQCLDFQIDLVAAM